MDMKGLRSFELRLPMSTKNKRAARILNTYGGAPSPHGKGILAALSIRTSARCTCPVRFKKAIANANKKISVKVGDNHRSVEAFRIPLKFSFCQVDVVQLVNCLIRGVDTIRHKRPPFEF
ncbi:MAG TPA: hypothetical protein DCS48_00700 [Desulfovibrio sp.]|nr:hypothetical protein [Desulfovibrio sp.]